MTIFHFLFHILASMSFYVPSKASRILWGLRFFCCHRRRQWILESTQSRKYYLLEKNHWDGKERKGKFHDGKSLKHKCHMDRKSGKGKILPSVQLQSNPIIGSLTPWDRKVKGSWSWRGESWNANALTIDISVQVVVLIVKEYIFIQMSLIKFLLGYIW